MNPDKLHVLADGNSKHRFCGTFNGIFLETSHPENSGFLKAMVRIDNIHLFNPQDRTLGTFLAREIYAPVRWESRKLCAGQHIEFTAKVVEQQPDKGIPLTYRFTLTAPTKVRQIKELPHDPNMHSIEIVDTSPDRVHIMMRNANSLPTEASEHTRFSLLNSLSPKHQEIVDTTIQRMIDDSDIPIGGTSKKVTGVNLRYSGQWTEGEFWTRKIKRMVRRR